MGDLILVRHGETEWSLSGRHTGRTDVPLTDNGREQARRLAPLIARHHIAAAFVSPMQRALETARLAGIGGARVDADLSEWDYGGYEGVTTFEIHRTRPDWFLLPTGSHPDRPSIPGRAPTMSGRARTACSPRSTRRWAMPRAAWSWSPTAISCGC